MRFNEHSNLAGSHAFLSASNHYWVNYDEEKLAEVFRNAQAARRGTELHAFAHDAVRLKIRQAENNKTLNRYVNDALGFRMQTEQILFYSPNAYGTADAIAFRDETLRIHDLKTGVLPGKMMQLRVYVALFCLEYGVKPADIGIELRIYQNDEIVIEEPTLDEIVHIMSTIVAFDRQIEIMRMEGVSG